MKYLLSALLGIALLSPVGWAQDPPTPPPPTPVPKPVPKPTPRPITWTINGNTIVPEHTLVRLQLAGDTAAPDSTQWLVFPDVSEYQAGGVLVFTAQPGAYTVIAFAIADGKGVLLKSAVTITGVTPNPPGPTPSPTPPPTPVPTGRIWALGIFDTAVQQNLPSGQLAVYGSPTIRNSVKQAGAIWRRFDINDSVPTKGGVIQLSQTKWGAAAQSVGLPAIVVVDETSAVISATPLPNTEDGVVDLVKKASGH